MPKERKIVKEMKEEDLKKIVHELEAKGLTSEKIGLILRDTHGIPRAKVYGKKLSKLLNEKKDADLHNLTIKVEKLKAHMVKNKQDKVTKRTLTTNEARLKKYKEYRQIA